MKKILNDKGFIDFYDDKFYKLSGYRKTMGIVCCYFNGFPMYGWNSFWNDDICPNHKRIGLGFAVIFQYNREEDLFKQLSVLGYKPII